ncbi:MAG: hypothetical protein A2049_05585 [Elusimicrobia bacterium GWA2_62_23]|nr:MAG: hypothetical protein A2049_05585 [Elusimicrobia bacterium GWA2_62_23]
MVTSSLGSHDNPTKVVLVNSPVDLNVWLPNNKPRGDKPKINQRLWQNGNDIIAPWYYSNIKTILEMLEDHESRNKGLFADGVKLRALLRQQLDLLSTGEVNPQKLHSWCCDVMQVLRKQKLDMSWFFPKRSGGALAAQTCNIPEKNILLLVECISEADQKEYCAFAFEFDALPPIVKDKISAAKSSKIEFKSGEVSLSELLQIDPIQNPCKSKKLPEEEEGAVKDAFEEPAEMEISDKEGKAKLKEHLHRERSKKLVKEFKKNLKSFNCEACEFNFKDMYGDLGEQFVEAHHIKPLGEGGERETKISDLAAVCSNCHRMLHKRNPQLTMDALRSIIAKKKSQ